MNYMINPLKMGGLVKEVSDDVVKVHLHGRLGVITIPKRFIIASEPLEAGHDMEFYFSYIQVVEETYDYDYYEITTDHDIVPCLLGGTITEVNDTAIKVKIMNGLGTIAVPLRWAFTSIPLKVGLHTEFYFSCMNVVGKCNIPVESI